MNSVYSINKGINRAIEFRGLKAQYITYLAIGLVALLLLFIVLYVAGVNAYVDLVLVLGLGGFLIWKVFRMSHKYGQHGLMKRRAKRSLPTYVYFNSRKLFSNLKDISPELRGDAGGRGVETGGNHKLPTNKDQEGRP
ncbi:MAG: DUF4133 domain-containing protein [Mucilaginibacter sp.]